MSANGGMDLQGIASCTLVANGDRYCVYVHKDGDRVFYLGQGTLARPFERSSRTERWKAYVRQLEIYTVCILETFPTKEAAVAAETALLHAYQPFCNFTGARLLGDVTWKVSKVEGRLPEPHEAEYMAMSHALWDAQAENTVLRRMVKSMERRPRQPFWSRLFWWYSASPSPGGTTQETPGVQSATPLPGQASQHNGAR